MTPIQQKLLKMYADLQKCPFNATLVSEIGKLSVKVDRERKRKKNVKEYVGLKCGYRYLDN